MTRREMREREERRRRMKRKRILIRRAFFGGVALLALIVVIIIVTAVVKHHKGSSGKENTAEAQEAEQDGNASAQTASAQGPAAKKTAAPRQGKTGWNLDGNGWWYLAEDGSSYAGGWQAIDGQDYYFKDDGYLATGWQNIGGKDVFFRKSGIPEDDREIRYIALTFDEGPSENTEQILTALTRFDAKGTFFVAGGKVEAYSMAMQHLVENGMEIGSYTYDNEPLVGYDPLSVVGAVRMTDELIEGVIGSPADLLRPPSGQTDEIVLANAGKPLILWTNTYSELVEKKEDGSYDIRTDDLKDGAIVRLIDTYQDTPAVTQALCEALYAEGYKMVTVSELAQKSGTTMEDGVEYRAFRTAAKTPPKLVSAEEEESAEGAEETEENAG